jgi:hypothetical protein
MPTKATAINSSMSENPPDKVSEKPRDGAWCRGFRVSVCTGF